MLRRIVELAGITDGISRVAPRFRRVTITLTGGDVSGKNTAVFGIYPTHASSDAAVDTLKTRGFRSADFSVLFPQNVGSNEFGHEKGTKSAEGAGSGAVIGGALGWLAGIGKPPIAGVGPFIAAGPIVATLAGMGAGGAIGGVTDALIGLGIPE
jgi:hypothetical protein